jgi:hypothetical protein
MIKTFVDFHFAIALDCCYGWLVARQPSILTVTDPVTSSQDISARLNLHRKDNHDRRNMLSPVRVRASTTTPWFHGVYTGTSTKELGTGICSSTEKPAIPWRCQFTSCDAHFQLNFDLESKKAHPPQFSHSITTFEKRDVYCS